VVGRLLRLVAAAAVVVSEESTRAVDCEHSACFLPASPRTAVPAVVGYGSVGGRERPPSRPARRVGEECPALGPMRL